MSQFSINSETLSPEDRVAIVTSHLKGTYSDVLGLEILEARPGFCRAVLPIKKEFLNPLGGLHGGFMYTIADTVGGIAASGLLTGENVTTISGTMQFLRAGIDLPKLYTEATVIKDGKRVAFVETEVMSGDGTLYAKASFSFAHIRLK